MENTGTMNGYKNPSKSAKILVVDDHALIRKGIMALLKNHNSDWDLHEAEDGVKAILKAEEIDPDIILLDYHMPKLDGAKAANIIMKALPRTKIIIVTMDVSPEMVIEIIHAGVAGIVSKQSPEDELILAIDTVKNGKRHLSMHASEIVSQNFLTKKKRNRKYRHTRNKLLTDRETEILKYIVKGLSCPAIAKVLSISQRTVSNHKASMFRKCQVKSTIELVRFAIKTKTVPISEVNHVPLSK
jgi:two-component system, NarL family, response regulator NreC